MTKYPNFAKASLGRQMTQGSVNVWVIGAVIILIVLVGGWMVLRGDDGVNEQTGEVVDQEAPLRSAEQSFPSSPEASRGRSAGQAPHFALEDYRGNIVSSDDFKGKPTIINAWAAWCPFCLEELDDFVEAQQQLGDNVKIIAIDRAESLSTAKGFTDELGVTDDLVFLLDPTDSFYKSIGGFAMPETLFVNADGTIGFHKRGPMTADEIVERASELIQ